MADYITAARILAVIYWQKAGALIPSMTEGPRRKKSEQGNATLEALGHLLLLALWFAALLSAATLCR